MEGCQSVQGHKDEDIVGKGSRRRPRSVSRHEEDLRWKYMQGGMSFLEFEKRLKQIRKMESKKR